MVKRRSDDINIDIKRIKYDTSSDSDSDSVSSDSSISKDIDNESVDHSEEVTNINTLFELLEKTYGKLSSSEKEFITIAAKRNRNTVNSDLDYFRSISSSKQKQMILSLNTIKQKNEMHIPYLFKILQSEAPLDIKSEIVRKLELHDSTCENSKMIQYIESVLKIPFGKFSKQEVDKDSSFKEKHKFIKKAEDVLDNAVYGHDDCKNKILQVLAQYISNEKAECSIIGLVGVQGCGKTTLCMDGISKILNKPFCYCALGGATDVSFLEGHNYCWEGSSYGKMADLLIKSQVMDPVIYFDELDKVSTGWRGDEIINSLMHLIDPSQNKFIQDKYFQGIPLDLSRATFIFSYNSSDKINPVLLDRITEIELSGFETPDKLEISYNFLIPKISKEVGIKSNQIKISDKILKFIIENYTYEGGVRKLKEVLSEIYKELNLRSFKHKKNILPIKLTEEILKEDILRKRHIYTPERIHKLNQIGKISGMYATDHDVGGIIPVEVVTVPSDKKLDIEMTGLLEKIIKESTQVSKTVAWNLLDNNKKQEINKKWKKHGNEGLHIHMAEGAVPKDGPSAGLAITSGIISRLLNIPIKNDVAVTGEIDLSGNAMEIGGLTHKLHGAKKAGIKLALCPRANKNCLNKIKKEYPYLIDNTFNVKLVDNIWNVLDYVLEDNDEKFVRYTKI